MLIKKISNKMFLAYCIKYNTDDWEDIESDIEI